MSKYIPPSLDWVREQVELYESSLGAKGTTLKDTGLPVIIVTHRGRKTGAIRKIPLMKVVDGENYILVASMGGAPKHPGWYHNIRAQGEIKAQVASDVFQAKTRVAAGEEREAIWEQMVAMYPPFGDYQVKAGDREIPVVILEPIRQ